MGLIVSDVIIGFGKEAKCVGLMFNIWLIVVLMGFLCETSQVEVEVEDKRQQVYNLSAGQEKIQPDVGPEKRTWTFG